MKINSNLLMALLLGLSFGANSHAAVFGFDCITNNNATDCTAVEAQLSMTVTEVDSNTVSFVFTNSGSLASSITDIYFDFGDAPNYLSLLIKLLISTDISDYNQFVGYCVLFAGRNPYQSARWSGLQLHG